MKTVNVKAGKPYPVFIGEGIIGSVGGFAKKYAGGEKALIVTDNRVAEYYLGEVKGSLESAGYETFFFVFEEGERSKTAETLVDLLESAAGLELTRGDVFVALGGGVTGDLCGLAASLYMRGVDFIQIPTSLLAMVDSSVGGKTAVDLAAGKNLCGTFWQPSCVVCDPTVLSTLDPSVYSDGMAEVIKCGMIADADLFERVSKGTSADMRSEMIELCVRHKADIVEADERDSGIRAILNFGHTFGHAIEKLSDYSVTHGKAVASGMMIAARISRSIGLCDGTVPEKLEAALIDNGLPTEVCFDPDEIASAAMSDKKRKGGVISLVLTERIGKSVIRGVSVDELPELCRRAVEK